MSTCLVLSVTLDLFYPLFLPVPLIETFFSSLPIIPSLLPIPLFLSCVCMYVYLNVITHVCWCSLRLTWGLFLPCSPPYVLRQGLHWTWTSPFWLGLPSSEPLRGAHFCLPAPGLQTVLCLYVVPRDLNAGSYVCAVNPFTLSRLPDPSLTFRR